MITVKEYQEIGRAILDRQKELINEHISEYYMNKYTTADAYRDAIKEICGLK